MKDPKPSLLFEKEDLSKQLNKMTHRDAQLHVELRKKEAELNKLKDQLKKVIVEKSGNNKVRGDNQLDSGLIAVFIMRKNL